VTPSEEELSRNRYNLASVTQLVNEVDMEENTVYLPNQSPYASQSKF
jgi:hypothetical protein